LRLGRLDLPSFGKVFLMTRRCFFAAAGLVAAAPVAAGPEKRSVGRRRCQKRPSSATGTRERSSSNSARDPRSWPSSLPGRPTYVTSWRYKRRLRQLGRQCSWFPAELHGQWLASATSFFATLATRG
jgi:hypothetical protein